MTKPLNILRKKSLKLEALYKFNFLRNNNRKLYNANGLLTSLIKIFKFPFGSWDNTEEHKALALEHLDRISFQKSHLELKSKYLSN